MKTLISSSYFLVLAGLLATASASGADFNFKSPTFEQFSNMGDSGGKDVKTVPGAVSTPALSALASRLATEANPEVGGLLSATCRAGKTAATALCEFKFDLSPGWCWYGYHYITAEITIASPHKIIQKKQEWRRD